MVSVRQLFFLTCHWPDSPDVNAPGAESAVAETATTRSDRRSSGGSHS